MDDVQLALEKDLQISDLRWIKQQTPNGTMEDILQYQRPGDTAWTDVPRKNFTRKLSFN